MFCVYYAGWNIICYSQIPAVYCTSLCEDGFTDISLDRTASWLFYHITNVVDEFKISIKLIGQTCDGASVMSGHLMNGLQSKAIEAYTVALFTHSYAHVLI